MLDHPLMLSTLTTCDTNHITSVADNTTELLSLASCSFCVVLANQRLAAATTDNVRKIQDQWKEAMSCSCDLHTSLVREEQC